MKKKFLIGLGSVVVAGAAFFLVRWVKNKNNAKQVVHRRVMSEDVPSIPEFTVFGLCLRDQQLSEQWTLSEFNEEEYPWGYAQFTCQRDISNPQFTIVVEDLLTQNLSAEEYVAKCREQLTATQVEVADPSIYIAPPPSSRMDTAVIEFTESTEAQGRQLTRRMCNFVVVNGRVAITVQLLCRDTEWSWHVHLPMMRRLCLSIVEQIHTDCPFSRRLAESYLFLECRPLKESLGFTVLLPIGNTQFVQNAPQAQHVKKVFAPGHLRLAVEDFPTGHTNEILQVFVFQYDSKKAFNDALALAWSSAESSGEEGDNSVANAMDDFVLLETQAYDDDMWKADLQRAGKEGFSFVGIDDEQLCLILCRGTNRSAASNRCNKLIHNLGVFRPRDNQDSRDAKCTLSYFHGPSCVLYELPRKLVHGAFNARLFGISSFDFYPLGRHCPETSIRIGMPREPLDVSVETIFGRVSRTNTLEGYAEVVVSSDTEHIEGAFLEYADRVIHIVTHRAPHLKDSEKWILQYTAAQAAVKEVRIPQFFDEPNDSVTE